MIQKKYNAVGGRWFSIAEKRFRRDVEGAVKDVGVALEEMKNNPEKAVVSTPFALYRWVESKYDPSEGGSDDD